MSLFVNSYLAANNILYQHTSKPIGGGVLSIPQVILGIIGVIVVCTFFCIVMYISINFFCWKIQAMYGINGAQSEKNLTPTQRFILAASSPTIGNNYKCVIDIWDTQKSETAKKRVRELFEWGWGEFTYENAKNMVDECLNRGYNIKYKEYRNTGVNSLKTDSKYTDFQLELLEEVKQKYPKQGMLGWDLVRVLSIVGGAYMGGIMEYGEACEIALKACRLLQENFSSWDDMVGSYTLGYQFWRGKRKKDRLKYYKKLKKSWIYKISWDTELKEAELFNS